MAVTSHAGVASHRASNAVAPLRALVWRHPELPWVVVIAVAWVGLAVWHWADHAVVASRPWRFDVVAWSVMVVAMMLPGILAMLRRLAFGSLWRRRHRTAVLFASSYVGVWVALGVAGALAVAAAELVTGTTFDPGYRTVAIVLLAAALWQLTPSKRRWLRTCHLARPVATRGRAADRSVIAYGLFHARACAYSCGPIMAAMFVAAHDFHLMAPLAAVSVVERYQTRPTERIGALVIVLIAGLVMVQGT